MKQPPELPTGRDSPQHVVRGSGDTPSYRFQLLRVSDYKSSVWKNGLGETQEIAVYPPEGGFYSETYVWRLASIHFNASCSFSLSPNHDCTFLLLREGEGDESSQVHLMHKGEEERNEVKYLFPYHYSGDWPTTTTLDGEYAVGLLLSVDRGYAKAQCTIDTFGEGEDEEISAGKLITGMATVIYVIEGGVRITLDGDDQSIAVKGETAIVYRASEVSPIELKIEAAGEGVGEKAVIAMIEIIDHSQAVLDVSQSNRPPRRRGSIIIFDDQPIWTAPGNAANSAPSNATDTTAPAANGSIQAYFQSLPSPASSQSVLHIRHWDPAMHYQPPTFSTRHASESEVPPPIVKDRLSIDDFPVGAISTAWINMVKQGLSEWIRIPVIVARGVDKGPVIGVTAAIHGNELNGVPCIHRVITDIDVHDLRGTVVAIPCVNTPGYLRFMREFPDGKDLNRAFPGKEDGMASQVYAYQMMAKILRNFDYLIDLHTASFGRVNSYYVRADMNDPMCAEMAKLQRPQIILHNSGQDGTMRSSVHSRGIKAITVEIGNPQQFQNQYVQWSYKGVMRILNHLNMFTRGPDTDLEADEISNMIVCSKGFWIYTRTGGMLEVYPQCNMFVRRGDLIARIKNIFGNVVDEYYAPCTGITIGRSSNPVAMAGDRIIHMGVLKKKSEPFAKEAKENY